MATSYTSLLGLALPVTGELQGTWGDTVNNSITSLLDTAVAGTTALSTDGDVTLTTTTGASNQARQAILLCTGARTAQRTITAPAQSKIYTVINATTGGFSIKVVGVGPTTGVTIVAGESALIAWNGSDFIKISNTGGSASFTNVTVSGTTTLSGLTASTALALDASKNVVSVTNTGTGNNVLSASPTLTGTVAGASLQLSSLTSGRVTYATTSGLLTDSANMTFNGTRLTVAELADSGLTANRVTYATAGGVLTDSANLTFDGSSMVLNTSTSSDALRITQTGAGNALLVEDSANPDSTPFVINASGQTVIGYTVPVLNSLSVVAPTLQVHGTGSGPAAASITSWATGVSVGARLLLSRSEGGVVGTQTIVDSGDQMGYLGFTASDGTGFIEGARIVAEVDGTPGTNDMPGRLVFSTTADGASTPTERMRIDNAGQVGIGGTPAAGETLRVAKAITGATTSYGVRNVASVQSDVTTNVQAFGTTIGTQATAFTLASLNHFQAGQGTFGAGSTVTNQFGFTAASSLIGATNNFGFYSNIASGTGRWNFYANGTAANYFEGATTFNSGLTLNVGTANGVAYLNGSKVLTTGSALTFDGTTLATTGKFGITGSGSIPTASALEIGTNGAGTRFRYNVPTGGEHNFTENGSVISFQTASAHGWFAGGSEQMRLTSTGLGIGTSSPTARLTVVTGSPANNEGEIRLSDNATYYAGLRRVNATDEFRIGSYGPSQNITFYTVSSERMRLDAVGNLGLGVTPSASWSAANGPALQIGAFASVFNNSSLGSSEVAYNTIRSGSDAYVYNITGIAASRFQQRDGAFRFFTAPSGTAGNAISFTQAMTLDASGNLGVGTTSMSRRLQIQTATTGTVDAISWTDGATDTGYLGIVGGGGVRLWAGGFLAFGSGGGGSYTERARIDSSGNVGIGTSSPSTLLHTSGTVTSNVATGNVAGYVMSVNGTATGFLGSSASGTTLDSRGATFLSFQTNSSERARIDSSGNLLVGTTSVPSPGGVSGQGLIVNNSSNNGAWSVFQSTGASSNRGIAVSYTGASPNDGFNEAYFFRDSTATRFLVKSNGGINNYSANNTNLSDRREKTNFAPAGEYLSKICAIPVQTFNYADQNLEQDPGLTLGVVAQDVQAVAPELVTESNWGTEEEPKMRLSIYQTDLQYALMKCIQEQQAIIEQLKARLDAANL